MPLVVSRERGRFPVQLLRVAKEDKMKGNGCDYAGLRDRLMKPKSAMAAKADETRNEPYYG
jgi:hypothetical protein